MTYKVVSYWETQMEIVQVRESRTEEKKIGEEKSGARSSLAFLFSFALTFAHPDFSGPLSHLQKYEPLILQRVSLIYIKVSCVKPSLFSRYGVIYRARYHPKSFGAFEKRTPGVRIP